jgi:NADPH:quinone reductase-like Zn-dependent oxidoreductase
MKIVRLYRPAGLDQLRIETAEHRRPGPGEVLVRIKANSLNFHDYSIVTGMTRAPEGIVPLSDGAGEVVEVGSEVQLHPPRARLFAPGDAVMSTFFPRWLDGSITSAARAGLHGEESNGFACEYATVSETALTRQPRGYSHAEAATLPCAAVTAWRALMVEGRLRSGETVVVQGTGGVSVFALQFAKAAGAIVIATSSSDEKLERLRHMGADHLVNYRSQPQWARAVLDFTGGQGADHVIEVGGPGSIGQSIHACRIGGHVSMIGVLGGREGPVSTSLIMWKNIRLQGITVGSRRDQIDMVAAIEAIGLRPVIDSHFPLHSIAEAFRHQESGRHFGKIVLDV